MNEGIKVDQSRHFADPGALIGWLHTQCSTVVEDSPTPHTVQYIWIDPASYKRLFGVDELVCVPFADPKRYYVIGML